MKIKNKPTFILSQKEYDILYKAVDWYDINADQIEEAGMGDLDLYMIFATILNQSKIDDNDCGDDDEFNSIGTSRIEALANEWDELINKIINGD